MKPCPHMSRAIKVDLAAYKNVTHSFIITRWRQNVSALLHLPQFRPPKTPAWIAPDNRIMSEKHSGNFYMEATWGIPRSFVDERTPAECFSRGKFGGGYEDWYWRFGSVFREAGIDSFRLHRIFFVIKNSFSEVHTLLAHEKLLKACS